MKTCFKITLALIFFSFTKPGTSSDDVVKNIGSTLIPETINFGAISDGKKVIVSWNKPNESISNSYTIERSMDGLNFMTALVIKGAGKMKNVIEYTDIDYTPFSGISYYRLKQTDDSGISYYSQPVMVNYEVTKDGGLAPCTKKIPDQEELKTVENKQILVVMYDGKGHEHIAKIRIVGDTKNLYIKDTNVSLEKGAYIVIASSFNRLCSQTLLVN